MKKLLLYLIYFLGYTALCCAQVDSVKLKNSFIDKIENEISRKAVFTDNDFSDTVIFILKNKTLLVKSNQLKRHNWDNIKRLFKGTDYIVNRISAENYRMPIKVKGLQYYRLYNHVNGYIIGYSKNGCISVIQEEMRVSTLNPSKNRGHHH